MSLRLRYMIHLDREVVYSRCIYGISTQFIDPTSTGPPPAHTPQHLVHSLALGFCAFASIGSSFVAVITPR